MRLLRVRQATPARHCLACGRRVESNWTAIFDGDVPFYFCPREFPPNGGTQSQYEKAYKRCLAIARAERLPPDKRDEVRRDLVSPTGLVGMMFRWPDSVVWSRRWVGLCWNVQHYHVSARCTTVCFGFLTLRWHVR